MKKKLLLVLFLCVLIAGCDSNSQPAEDAENVTKGKKESLSVKEQEEYKKHTVYGYSAVSEAEWLSGQEKKMILFHHDNLAGQVAEIQKEAERRTYAIGYALEALTEKLVLAAESGSYTEEELNAIRDVLRSAQFYWDFVFVENSEGAHNSALTKQCLDKSEALIEQGMAMFK